jgi:hypothetical protein
MAASSLQRLVEVFSQVADPRKARGVRHPFPAILSLVFLGLLARITEMAVLTRWAAAHWDELRGPLSTRPRGLPHKAVQSLYEPSPHHGLPKSTLQFSCTVAPG